MKTKTCPKCNNQFNLISIIDGISRNLCKRIYCFNCSPFGNHNTKKLNDDKDKRTSSKKTSKVACTICNRLYYYKKNNGHTSKVCNSCVTKSARRERKKQAVIDFGGKCMSCGYNKYMSSLCFHHTDPSNKEFTPGANWGMSKEKMNKELEKCILLCSNCHHAHHAGELDISHLHEDLKNSIRFDELQKIKEIQLVRRENIAIAPTKNICLCGTKIEKRNKNCIKCMPRKIIWPSKEELEKLVWELPTQKVGKQLGVSDVAIAKECKKYGISKPPRGHWMKPENKK